MPFEQSEDLLNIYEVQQDEGPIHLVAMLTPEHAEKQGLFTNLRAIVGEFDPDLAGEFDPDTFKPNPDFVEAFILYMNDEVIRTTELLDQARDNPSGILYLVDPRCDGPEDPRSADLLGGFAVDDAGLPIPESFRYNPDHLLFDHQSGPSGILSDVKFYEWIRNHPSTDDESNQPPDTQPT